MKYTLLATVIAGLVGSAALAGSPEPYIEEVYMPAPQPVADWAGFYAGGTGGIQSGTITPGFTFDATTYGGFAGYNMQSGNLVYGVEIAAQTGTIRLPPSFDLDYVVDAKARIGYSLGDALLYASGGYTTTDTGLLGLTASGWNAGAGLDYAVTDKFFLGGEYTYRNLPNTTPGGFDYASHGGQLRAGIRF
ncbi:MAG: outer membrane beta-barrel protein [Paracoccaceae bacterium]